MSEASSVQLIFIDLLFLVLAGGMAFWFRAWLRGETGRLDERLAALEKQQKGLEQVVETLSGLCRTLERGGSAAARPTLGETPASVPPRRTARPRRERPAVRSSEALPAGPEREWEEMAERSREAYRLARELLEQGMSTSDVARQVGLGVAEVNVLKRMRDAAR